MESHVSILTIGTPVHPLIGGTGPRESARRAPVDRRPGPDNRSRPLDDNEVERLSSH
jgi:hypothetical protein